MRFLRNFHEPTPLLCVVWTHDEAADDEEQVDSAAAERRDPQRALDDVEVNEDDEECRESPQSLNIDELDRCCIHCAPTNPQLAQRLSGPRFGGDATPRAVRVAYCRIRDAMPLGTRQAMSATEVTNVAGGDPRPHGDRMALGFVRGRGRVISGVSVVPGSGQPPARRVLSACVGRPSPGKLRAILLPQWRATRGLLAVNAH